MTRPTLSTRAMLFAAAALCTASLGGAPAFADDTPPEISLTEKLLTGLGLVPPTPPEIDYRERAPLVVAPHRRRAAAAARRRRHGAESELAEGP